jgi:hypothetical protein
LQPNDANIIGRRSPLPGTLPVVSLRWCQTPPDLVEHTIRLPSPCRSLSTHSSMPEATRTSPSFKAWTTPRRRWPEI